MVPGLASLFRRTAFAAALAGLACPHAANAGETTTIRLMPAQTYQTIAGWEATADIPDRPSAAEWAPYHDAQLDLAVAEGGINRVRLEVRSGAESATGIVSQFIRGELAYADWRGRRYEAQNDNDDPFSINWAGFDFAELDWYMDNTILALREKLAARGERLFVNLCYVSFRDGHFFQMEPEEYAEFVLATYEHLDRKYGLVPDSWEVVLEPDLPRDGWSGTDMGRAIVASARRLQGAGFTPAFVVPSVTDMRNTLPYLDEIAAVPGAMGHVVEISFHRYKGASPEALAAIAARAETLGIRTGMLEWWFGKATYDVLFEDLTHGNVSAWQGRMLEGLYRPQADGTLQPRAEVRYNALLFRAARPGARRIGTDSDHPAAFDAVAFINRGGGYAVVVRARQGGGSVTVAGLPAGRYRATYAVRAGTQDIAGTLSPGPDGRLTVEIPDSGLLSITPASD